MKKVTKTLWVNPLPRKSVQGRDQRRYTMNLGLITGTEGGLVETSRLNKNKEFGVSEKFNFPVDPLRQRLVTGLDVAITNPFKGLEVQDIMTDFNLIEEWRVILEKLVNKENINKQTYLEIKHSVKPNYYTSELKWFMGNMPSDMSLYDKERSFLQDLMLILYDRPNVFDDATPRQELLMEMIQVLPTVAKNKAIANTALHSWFISEENEEEAETARKSEIIEKAVYNLYKLKNEYGAFKTYQVASTLFDHYGQPLVKGTVTSEAVATKLSNFLTGKTNQQMENVHKFINLVEEMTTKEGAKRFKIKYLVQQSINANVIVYRDNEYIWHSKAGTPDVYKLGSSYDKLINFFLKEYTTYNKKSDVSNWYKDLFDEVSAKGIQLDD